jgi:hypothetical protein
LTTTGVIQFTFSSDGPALCRPDKEVIALEG